MVGWGGEPAQWEKLRAMGGLCWGLVHPLLPSSLNAGGLFQGLAAQQPASVPGPVC